MHMLSDVTALDRLERLLDLEPEARAVELGRLAEDDPQLHGRMLRLIDAAQRTQVSQLSGSTTEAGLASALALKSGQCIGGYALLRELGRGGMAVVWLAQRADAVLKRQVALKLPLQCVDTPRGRARFTQEKDVLAALEHPHIARLYDAGVDGQQPFIALEFVDGVSITRYCEQQALDVVARLQLFLQVLEAVDHAHRHMVVHRDLKPSNILVDVAGQVKLLDFGIAKLLTDPAQEAASTLTQVGNAVLTPTYAAPEQATGQAVSTSTDIFVLGVVLHELLTGTLPYARACGETPALAQIVDALLRSEPTRPSQAQITDAAAHSRGSSSIERLRAVLRGDLDTIVCKALSFGPKQRYGSAESFADDVQRYLEHRPVQARRPGMLYSGRLFFRRNRVASLAVAGAGVLAVLGAAAAADQYRQAHINADRAIATRDFMFDTLARAEPDEKQSSGPVTARQIIDEAVERAREDFKEQPELQGELLSEFGRIYGRLEEPQLARQVMEEAWQLLERSAPPDGEQLNQARTQMSGIFLNENDLERALELATLARENCRWRPVPCARVRANANAKLSDIHRMAGRISESLEAMQQTVKEATAAYGESSPDVVTALLNLAIQSRNAGRPREAKAALDRAFAASAESTMMRVDRLKMQQIAAIIDFDLGRHQQARAGFEQLLAATETRTERAVQLRMLATVDLGLGHPQSALESARAALELADPRQATPEPLFARQVDAEALALLGKTQEAREEIETVITSLRDMGRSENAPEVVRVRRSHGEILLRAGLAQEALVELQAVLDRLTALPSATQHDLAQVLELIGCAQRELGREAEALAAHRRARAYFQAILPEEHPYLARNTLYQAAAGRDAASFTARAMQARKVWVPTSIWQQLIDARLDASKCRDVGKACVFVL